MSVTFFGVDANRLLAHGRHGRHPAVVELEAHDAAFLNLSNANARALLDLLGVDIDDDLTGSMSIAGARRAVIRARRVVDRNPARYTRPTEMIPGGPRPREDGVVELHPAPRAVLFGLDEHGLRDRLDRFEHLLLVLGEKGATHVRWG